MSDDRLFELLAAANSQDSGPLKTAKGIADLGTTYINTMDALREKRRKHALEDYFDSTQLPMDTLDEIIPGASGVDEEGKRYAPELKMNLSQLMGLTRDNAPVASLLKGQDRVSPFFAAWNLSDGDPVKFQQIMEAGVKAGVFRRKINRAEASMIRTPARPKESSNANLDAQYRRIKLDALKQQQEAAIRILNSRTSTDEQIAAAEQELRDANAGIRAMGGLAPVKKQTTPPPEMAKPDAAKPGVPKPAPAKPTTKPKPTGGAMSAENKSLFEEIMRRLEK